LCRLSAGWSQVAWLWSDELSWQYLAQLRLWRCLVNIRTIALVLGIGLALQVHADAPGRVWVYQPDGGSYRIDNHTPRYDPRSPYSPHRQYQQNLPPRYEGQLPPRYYDRHRLDRPQRWNGHRPGVERPQRWQHERPQGSYRLGPGAAHRHSYQAPQRRHFDQRGYRRD